MAFLVASKQQSTYPGFRIFLEDLFESSFMKVLTCFFILYGALADVHCLALWPVPGGGAMHWRCGGNRTRGHYYPERLCCTWGAGADLVHLTCVSRTLRVINSLVSRIAAVLFVCQY